MTEQVPSKEQTAEPQFMRAYAHYIRKPVREHGLSQSYLDSLADELDAAAAEIERHRATGEPASGPVAPIAKVTVWAHLPPSVELYAPGLPPGQHDLFPVPLNPNGEMRPHPAFTQPPSGDESTLDITCPECSHQFFARAAEPAGEIVAEVHSDTLRWLVDDDHPVRTCGHAYLWSRPTKGAGE